MKQSTIACTLARGIRFSVAAALLAGLVVVTQPAQAVTFEVTTTGDSGPGSLRDAITQANNTPGDDTITFDPALNTASIFLAGAAGEDANASGDLDILDGGNLTIQGNGAANTIIDGGGKDRVFHICPGGGCTNTVTLNGMTIRNGKVTGDGGGIYNAAGSVNVDASNVSNNLAYNDGGGIFNRDTLNIQNGSIIGGSGTRNWAYVNGGGIFNSAGTVTVINSNVSNNTANSGGGIFNWEEGILIITNSTIGGAEAGNTASEEGGGIFNQYTGITTVNGSAISANTANYGGGIYNNGTLNIQGSSTIGGSGVGNEASTSGGGIFNHTAGTITVEGSAVSANTALFGGGIFNAATLTVQSVSTIGGAGAGNAANNYGGGIYIETGGTTTVDGSTVSANTANNDGGIFNHSNNGTTMVTGSRILNNLATTNGGGVFNEWNVAWATSVTGSCIVGNSATSFFNNQSAQQTATGNWWGAATGPNTPGADTVGGSVDTSGYLTEPILGCSFELTVSRDGTGYGSVSSTPAGIVCGTDCSETYNYGTVVTLIATADTGSTFTGWSGACSGTAACVVTMDAAKSVTATFMVTVYDVFLPIIMK